MAHRRKWYNRLIGYEFCYNGRGIILEDVFYFEDDNSANTSTGYAMRWADEEQEFICDYKTFKEFISQTDYPRR